MVDGDLLLLLTEKELEQDLQMTSALLRKRFIRELESLKVCSFQNAVNKFTIGIFIVTGGYGILKCHLTSYKIAERLTAREFLCHVHEELHRVLELIRNCMVLELNSSVSVPGTGTNS